jgi:uncharacterized protein (TIGR00297 family)
VEPLLAFISHLNPWVLGMGLNTILLTIVSLLPKQLLTLAGLLNAWLLGVIVWGTLGWRGYLIVGFYFIIGSAVTRVGLAIKEASGIAEKRSGARGAENVWGSALAGTICAISLSIIQINYPLLLPVWSKLLILGYAASFATKLADTTASEIGKAYGKSTFLITTFQPVPRGTEGAVSLEGTVAGIAASIAISLVAFLTESIDAIGMIICIIAAFIATNIESAIGATVQEKYPWLTNELVNIINTTIGAIIAIVLGFFLY